MTKPVQRNVALVDIFKNEGWQETQSRALISKETVGRYEQAYAEGADIPPIVLFIDDDGTFFVGDGFHRLKAALKLTFKDITALVYQGGYKEALTFSLSANDTHGLPRTKEDRRNSVIKALTDKVFAGLSAREIAEICAVSHTYVNDVIRDQFPERLDTTVKGKDGKEYPTLKDRQPQETQESPQVGGDVSDSDDTAIEKATATPVTLHDSAGNIIPKHLEPILSTAAAKIESSRKALREAIKNLRDTVTSIGDLPGEQGFNPAMITPILGEWRDLDKAAKALDVGVKQRLTPFAICPYCKAIDPNPTDSAGLCRACGTKDGETLLNRGWVQYDVYRDCPKDVRESELTADQLGYWAKLDAEAEAKAAEERAKAAEEKEKKRSSGEPKKKSKKTSVPVYDPAIDIVPDESQLTAEPFIDPA